MFYTSDDAKLFYTEFGSGPPLVLLHPTPVNHEFWLPIAPTLAARYRVILPDLRGHGQSELGRELSKAQAPLTMSRLGQDLEQLFDILGISEALFAGCSIGGYALFELWRRAPHRVRALAFCSSRPQPDSPANKAKRVQWIENLRQHGAGAFFDTMAQTLIGHSTRERGPAAQAQIRAMMQPTTAEAVIAVQQGLSVRPDSVPTAATITAPTCVIAAAEDDTCTPAEMKVLAEAVRNRGYNSEYHEVPEAGHYAPWERPDLVAALLQRFFASI